VNALTIPSRALEVWRRLYTRYRLEPFPASVSPDVSKTIQPITDADALLKVPSVQSQTTPTLSTGSALTFVTVPVGRRWTLYALTIGQVSGDRDITSLRVVDPVTGENVIYNDHAGATSLIQLFTPAIVLDEGWILAEDITGGTTDGIWTSRVFVQDEAAF